MVEGPCVRLCVFLLCSLTLFCIPELERTKTQIFSFYTKFRDEVLYNAWGRVASVQGGGCAIVLRPL